MLKSNRFTKVPTKDCVDRLEAALSNSRPIARGEQHRGAVTAIQTALADLNSSYLLVAEIDGYYGSRTSQAVEAFQRDYGLIADGMVAKQTMGQLDSLYTGGTVRNPRGLSVHVGLNRVDAGHYGSEYPLESCVNDARKMQEIAEALGYLSVTFEDEDATCTNFSGFMRRAISDLYAGDSLLVTFSGHGSQIPNTNPDVESDGMDETLCLFDRMFLDDELYALLAQFREGVRIHAVFDSCHSGTVAKDFVQVSTDRKAAYQKDIQAALHTPGQLEKGFEDDDLRPIASGSLTKAVEGDKPEYAKSAQPKNRTQTDKEIASLFGDLFDYEISGKSKRISTVKTANGLTNQIYENHKDLYDSIKNVVGPLEVQALPCSVITLSACNDSETTQAGPIYSLFTSNLATIWDSGSFNGTYVQFLRNVTKLSATDATPELNTYGTNLANARRHDRPFVF